MQASTYVPITPEEIDIVAEATRRLANGHPDGVEELASRWRELVEPIARRCAPGDPGRVAGQRLVKAYDEACQLEMHTGSDNWGGSEYWSALVSLALELPGDDRARWCAVREAVDFAFHEGTEYGVAPSPRQERRPRARRS
jgi:hypothetical protein